MTQRDDQVAKAAKTSDDNAEIGDGAERSDRGSAPADRDRTGEEQAAINRENDPPA